MQFFRGAKAMDQKESASKTLKKVLLSFAFPLVAALATVRLGRGFANWQLVLANVMFGWVVLMILWNQTAAMRRAKNISESIISKHQNEPGARIV
jgi:hypothetical protein